MFNSRVYYLDFARAFLMLIGVPFHVAHVYMSYEVWILNDNTVSPICDGLIFFVRIFRMPCFFLIAGYFAALKTESGSYSVWLQNRFRRLGVPFVSCMLVLSVPQYIFVRYADGRAVWPINAQELVAHLWFLPTLIAFCVVFIVAKTIMGRMSSGKVRQRQAYTGFAYVIGLGMLCGATKLAGFLMVHWFPDLATSPLNGLALPKTIGYSGCFFAGVVLFGAGRSSKDILQLRYWIFGPVVVPLLLPLFLPLGTEMRVFISGLLGLSMSYLFLALLQDGIKAGNGWVRELVDASYTIYLVHLPLGLIVCTALMGVSWPAELKALLASVAVLCLSYYSHKLIKRSRIMLFLFNGANLRRARTEAKAISA